MESLLRWSIENTASEDGGSKPPPQPRQDIDPGLIDLILGKSDAVLMKEALAVGMDGTLNPEARVTALDDLEMLVEQIDNATNLTPLKMYPQILSLLSPQTPDRVRMQALWVLGTAAQNNPKAQADFLTHDPLPIILSILSPKGSQAVNLPSPQTRSKAAYALSAALKHNAAALSRLDDAGGWDVLRDALQDSDITIRRKIAFLINALLLPTSIPPSELTTPKDSENETGPTIHVAPPPPPVSSTTVTSREEVVTPPSTDPTSTTSLALSALRIHKIVPVLIESLTAPLPHGPDADGEERDPDYVEKAARALVTYLDVGGVFTSEERLQLSRIVTFKEASGLGENEWCLLKQGVLNP